MLEEFAFINTHYPWFFAGLAFLFGTITGSFLNVCIYRIPAGRSVVVPGSTCSCGQPVRWVDNIPILSWLILRGRARCCGAAFSIRYPVIEALTGLLFLALWVGLEPIPALLGMLFAAFLICATFIDLDHMIIPDRFSIGGAVIGVVFSFLFPQLHAVELEGVAGHLKSGTLGIVGMLVGAGLVYWIAVLGEVVFRKPAMGEGDVKFVGFIGAFCGWQGAVFAMFGGALIGTVILLPVMLLSAAKGDHGAPDPKESFAGTAAGESEAESDEDDEAMPGTHIPFGPMLALAGLIYYLGFGSYVDAYFATFSNVLFIAP